ncbi:ATPase domain-containing protein [Noviluteimonas gilva]|uniref:non-specific serine/threonine protein kinase n=1 Tax=Noviluteimonas gilva TaxID=2682097 RepID=A0A7C9M2A8_9GAMM|nr:ATPase domain-containing protein [Lysobacter gilvus]MUV14928.1 AAA family ATPase [Lysobacter gilvus]
MSSQSLTLPAPVPTGVEGLDVILDGGLTPHRLYLIEGVPGSGKTTMALQFLRSGAAAGERVLYVTLSETERELREVAHAHGWSLDGIAIHELFPVGDQLDPESQYTMFHPSEVELAETTRRVLDEVERLQPDRVVFDSLAELRLLAGSMLRFRRQVLALKQYFSGKGTTVLMLDESSASDQGLHVHTIVHGAIQLDHLMPDFGGDRRRLRISKMRGRAFRSGYHDYKIETGGVRVYPRLIAAHYRRSGRNDPVASELAELDLLLGGGLDRGTSTLLIGAAGAGKSSLASHFVRSAAARGERSAMFLFDESQRALVTRSRGIGFDIEACVAEGTVDVQSIDPAELSPGEFIHRIRNAVEVEGAKLVVLDSLNGFLNAMAEEHHVLIQLHELLSYLAQLDITTILIASQAGLIGHMQTSLDVSYLADTVVLLRYFESRGEVKQAISVLKKRTGPHERTIREMRITSNGLDIGEPLRNFRGVLTGVPQEVDSHEADPMTPRAPLAPGVAG